MNKRAEQWSNLKPEQKIEVALEISDACMQLCAAGIKAENPNLDEKRLFEELRKRVEWMKRNQEWKRRFKSV
ncbi:MAG: hypothetical protein ACPL4E_02450 [Thermoproteota archaeon]